MQKGEMGKAPEIEAAAVVKSMGKGIKVLLPHERDLLARGELINKTHQGASSVWLESVSSTPPQGYTNVYRPMGDAEVSHLVEHNQLPDTQPYQAIIEGEVGRQYAEKYLAGKKWVDTCPTSVVEFCAPVTLITALYEMQHKPEDGAMSMGLGHKAGGGLPMFNQSMVSGETTWRIVKVKRSVEKTRGKPPPHPNKNHDHNNNNNNNVVTHKGKYSRKKAK